MFNRRFDGRGIRRLVWISRIATMLFVAVMLTLFALFGPYAILAIVLVVPAMLTSFGTRLLSRGHLAGAGVTLAATLPCAALAVAVPWGHAFTAPVAEIGAVLLMLCCAVSGLAAAEMISRPDRWRDGRTFLTCMCVASTVTFVLAVALPKELARGWMAPGAAACALLFALMTAMVSISAERCSWR